MVARNAGHEQLHPEVSNAFLSEGFGYQGGPTYGASFMAPSWVLRILEAMPDVHVLGYKERGWARHQDVFMVQRATGWTDSRPAKEKQAGSLLQSMCKFLRRPRHA